MKSLIVAALLVVSTSAFAGEIVTAYIQDQDTGRTIKVQYTLRAPTAPEDQYTEMCQSGEAYAGVPCDQVNGKVPTVLKKLNKFFEKLGGTPVDRSNEDHIGG